MLDEGCGGKRGLVEERRGGRRSWKERHIIPQMSSHLISELIVNTADTACLHMAF